MIPAAGQAIVINEVLYDGPGADAGTFVELKGEPGTDLTGWTIVGVNGNGGADYATIVLDGYSIPADGYFVAGQDSTTINWDMIHGVDLQNGADEVELRYLDETMDSVCYGSSGDLVCEGGTYAPDVPGGTSIARCPDGQDTDDNEADFAADDTPTAGEENDADCGGVEPTDYTCAELRENDADGIPVHLNELVRVTDLILLTDVPLFSDDYMDAHATDGTGCIQLFDFGYDALTYPLYEGDLLEVVGTVAFYNGMTELVSLDVTVLGTAPVPAATELTTAVLAAGGEEYESCLISICGVYIVGGDDWPVEGDNANIEIDDGSGPSVMRLDKDTDIDGSDAVVEPFTVTGITTQYDSEAPHDSGYQIKPRYRVEIEDGVDCPTATFESTWGQIKQHYR